MNEQDTPAIETIKAILETEKAISFKAGQQAERDRLAAMAPEGARQQIAEIIRRDAYESLGLEEYDAGWVNDEHEQAYLNLVDRIWPIYQAKLEEERERVLKEVGKWLRDNYRFSHIMEAGIEILERGEMPK